MLDRICLLLSIIGCLNWGLVGIFRFDLVAWAFGGSDAIISRIVYTVIALAGVWCILCFSEATTMTKGLFQPNKMLKNMKREMPS